MNLSRQRSCDGKARHASKTAANTARNRLLRHTGSRRDEFAVYACDFCAGWHVGHAPRQWRQP